MHFLYRITNILNSKVYIGQSNKKTERWRQHKYFSKQEIPLQYIHKAMAKYGIGNFVYEVIATCHTQDDANVLEEELIKQYDSRNKEHGYNIASGGEAAWNLGLPSEQQPMYGKHHSEKSKEKSSKSNIGIKKPPHTKEWKENMSSIMKGRIITADWREKLSKSQRKFSEMQELEIISLYKNGMSVKKISEHYECAIMTVYATMKRYNR